MIKFTILLMVVATCVSSSVAFQCYSCKSIESPNCIDAKNVTSKQDCPELTPDEKLERRTTVCLKMVDKVDEDGIQHVSRSCGIKTGFVENCVGLKPKYKNMEHCSFCDSDLCNGSNPVQHNNLWMTLIPAIVTVAIIKLSF